jgi:hypothetical protein
MSNIFTLNNITGNISDKINIDELYDKQKQRDLNKLNLYTKILNRVHVRINSTSRQQVNEKCCWYIIPEMIIGIPKYDNSDCIAFIINKLKENGFAVLYVHPNALFITWSHWIPSYIRNELKDKTGLDVNEYGKNKSHINYPTKNDIIQSLPTQIIPIQNNNIEQDTNSKLQIKENDYTSIKKYKPKGMLFTT